MNENVILSNSKFNNLGELILFGNAKHTNFENCPGVHKYLFRLTLVFVVTMFQVRFLDGLMNHSTFGFWNERTTPLATTEGLFKSSSSGDAYNDMPQLHYDDVIMGAVASQITSLAIVYSIVYSSAYQRKHQSSASLAFVWRIHLGPVTRWIPRTNGQ